MKVLPFFIFFLLQVNYADTLNSEQHFISYKTNGFFQGSLKQNISEKYNLDSCSLTFEKGTETEPKTKQIFNNEVFAIHLLGSTPGQDTFLESVIFKRISKKKLRSYFRNFKKTPKTLIENDYGYSDGEGQWVRIIPEKLNLILSKKMKIDTQKSHFFSNGDIVNYELTLDLKRISGDNFELKELKLVGEKKAKGKEKFEKVIDVDCRDITKEETGEKELEDDIKV